MRMTSWAAACTALLVAACSETTFTAKPDEDGPIYLPDDTDVLVEDTDPGPPVTSQIPELSFSPSVIDFGYVDEGSSAEREVLVTNLGDAALLLTDLAVQGDASFTWSADADPFELAPGTSAPVRVTFTPSNTDDAADLSFATNDPYVPEGTVVLLGTGRNPLVVGSPSPLVFSDVPVGDVAADVLTLTNVGNAPVTVTGVTSSHPVFVALPFATALVIDPQSSATVDVVFSPVDPQAYAGELTIQSDARLLPAPVPVLAGGVGKPDAVCSVTPGTVSSLAGTATFVGSGSSDPRGRPLTYDWTLTQVPAGSSVSLAGLGQGPDRGPITPDLAGTYQARLVVTNDLGLASDPCFATLGVDAIPKLVANPTSLSFGTVTLGSNASRQFTLTNVGNAPATVTGITPSASVFTVLGSPPITLAPGDQQVITARFTPTGGGNVSGSYTVVSNAVAPQPVVTVQGSSTALDPVAVCSASPSTLVAIHETFSFVGSGSSDPNGLALTYSWAWVSQPSGSTLAMPAGGANRGPIRPELVGDYTARLTVTNSQGRSSTCTATAYAEPDTRLWVEMFWEWSNDDMDLHLVRANGTIGSDQDCYFGNCDNGDHLPWGVAGTADDPYLDLDDISGWGPENINIAAPEATFFRVVVHDYWASVYNPANAVTVRIYLDGLLRYDVTKYISGEDTYTTFALIDFTNLSNPTVVPQ